MLNKLKIYLYKKYSGDSDRFERMAPFWEKWLMDMNDWGIIDNLVQDLITQKNTKVSKTFDEEHVKRIYEAGYDDKTIAFLQKWVDEIN